RRLLPRQPAAQGRGPGTRLANERNRRTAMNATLTETKPVKASPASNPESGSSPKVFMIFGALAAAGLLAAGIVPRVARDSKAAESQQRANLAPKVVVESPRITPRSFEVTLPGSTRAFQDTTLYARTSGFISQILVDIGDAVRE